MNNTSQLSPQTIQDVTYLYATNYFGFASYTVLVWDHAITFVDEVQYIWKGRKKTTLIIILFFINRYLTPLNFILNLFAYLSPVWTPSRCAHFVRYEGATIVVALGLTALMMMIRVTAIYSGNRLILGLLVTIFVFEFGIMAWLLSGAHAVMHDPGIHGCSMIFSENMGIWPSASAWLPLLYDTVVITLTVSKTLYSFRGLKTSSASGGTSISQILLRDGILYFSVIFVANFVLTVMILRAPPGIQNIAAQFEQLITVTMISRITISLRKNVYTGEAKEDEWIVNEGSAEVTTFAFGMGGRQEPEADEGNLRVVDRYEFDSDVDSLSLESINVPLPPNPNGNAGDVPMKILDSQRV